MANLDPPTGLSDASRAIWRELVPGHVRQLGRRVLLEQALLALDRAAVCREVLAKEGLTIRNLGTRALHVHPLVAVEAQARALALQAFRVLGLNLPATKERAGIDIPEEEKPTLRGRSPRVA